MDWPISRGRLSLPSGVRYQDGRLYDSVLQRVVTVGGSGSLVLERISDDYVSFECLAQALSSQLGVDRSQVAADIKLFLLGLNSRHLVNIDLPMWTYVAYLWHASLAKLLGGGPVWFPFKRFALVARGRLRVDRIVAAIPPLYWLLMSVMVGGVAPQLLYFYPPWVVLTQVLAVSLSLVIALVIHELGHVLAIQAVSDHTDASYLVRTPLRFFTVHRADPGRNEIFIGLAGPALAIAFGVAADAVLVLVLGSEPTFMTLPFKLQVICLLPGFGDADRLWLISRAAVKSWWRRLRRSDA